MDLLLVLLALFIYFGVTLWNTRGRDNFRMSESMRLRRIEKKLDLILENTHIDFADIEADLILTKEERDLADTNRKINAIKLYKERTGADLSESKWVVDNYIRERRKM